MDIGPENAHIVHLNNPMKQLNLWKPRELEGGKRENGSLTSTKINSRIYYPTNVNKLARHVSLHT